MNQPANHLQYREEDRLPLTLAELSKRARISYAFIRLCLDNGCPLTADGLLSQAALLDWLFDHYDTIRACSGLKTFVSLDGLPDELQCKMRMANAILTLLEFGESRSSNPAEKQQLRWIRLTIEASLDKA